ncbi:sterol desaturase family protein [bacterium]|nr:sterol desaturase family protein [bacterium]
MLSLVLLEFILTRKKHIFNYQGKDFWSSVAIGAGNLVVNAVLKTLNLFVILYCYKIAPYKIPMEYFWVSLIPCMILLDFARYWAHRVAHESRFLWATHVTHHSSENYTFAVSFRLSWTQHIKIIFFIPVALMGFHPIIFVIAHQIEVLYQFWIHTELIRKLPKPIEYIFTTPSHHRVHHARNDKYIDKNYGSTFIIWDRIFGTFQPEEEAPEYGIKKPVNTYNPVILVFHEWVDVIRDTWHARGFKAKMKAMFGRP